MHTLAFSPRDYTSIRISGPAVVEQTAKYTGDITPAWRLHDHAHLTELYGTAYRHGAHIYALLCSIAEDGVE